MKKQPDIIVGLAIAAAVASIVLTAIAFWLSFAHLEQIAHDNGLSDERSWAWPAAVDLFIVIGETLMLRASLKRDTDWWAIGLTVFGSATSIGLNIAGVGMHAPAMQYAVAAVPPTAALIAFGAVMRQVHTFLAARIEVPVEEPVSVAPERLEVAPAALTERPAERPAERAQAPADERPSERPAKPKSERRTERPTKPKTSAPASVLQKRRERARRLYDDLGKRPEWTEIRDALVADKLAPKTISRPTIQRIRDAIEANEPQLAALGSDNVRALTGS